MLLLQVSGSQRGRARITPNLFTVEKPQAMLLKKPEDGAVPGLVPKRFAGSARSLIKSQCSTSWGWSDLAGPYWDCYSTA